MSKTQNLLTIQQDFSSHLFDKKNLKITQLISSPKQEALERLQIYRNNVLGNFESVLSSIFIVTKKIIGEEKFFKLVEKYCQKFPSRSGNLDEFGHHFPKFLKASQPAYLVDLAQLELYYHQSYFASHAAEKFDLKNFKKLAPEKFSELIFSLHPSCILFASDFAIYSIWQKNKKIASFAKPEFMLAYANQIFKLKAEEFLFLSEIGKGKKLYQIYQTLCKKSKKNINIGKLINHFISNGIIANYA